MRAAALALAFALGGCMFSSEAPLFDAQGATAPFADGARFQWRETGGVDPIEIEYRAKGNGAYEIAEIGETDARPLLAQFFPIRETPEDDYIVQVRFESDDAWGYAFMWPQGEDYWIQISPRILDEGEGPALRVAHCVMLPFGECQIQSAQALRDIYLTQIYQSGARESLGARVMVQSSLGSAARTKVSP